MTRLADYVMQLLAERGVRDIFLVSGGGIMHLLDAVGSHPAVRYCCNYHEQACVIAAEAYARQTGKIGVALVTVGPGAANAVSGVLGAWVDSIPVLVISGQVRQDLIADYAKQRQFGPQEANTLAMAAPVTKYAVRVTEPARIRYELEKALYLACSGRPGPAWVEIPLDVQGALVDVASLEGFRAPSSSGFDAGGFAGIVSALRASKRPLVVPGNGIHAAGAEHLLREFLDLSRFPVAVPFTAKDLVEEEYPRYAGVFGTAGQRRANFAVQNCDCLLALGAGLNTQKVGFNAKGFAPRAVKIIVDIDQQQIDGQVLRPDLSLRCDVRKFLALLVERASELCPSDAWLEAIRRWRERYPPVRTELTEVCGAVNSYVFMDRLSDLLLPTDTVVTGAGLDAVSCYQAFRVKRGQRVLISGWGSMGWDLPMAVGACFGSGKRRVVCVTGDGSMQWNLQEMLTIARNALPVKLFVFNNSGYSSIRATQNAFFNGRFVGSDFGSGLANPDFEALARAYGFAYHAIGDHEELKGGLSEVLSTDGSGLCEVRIAPEQAIEPKATAFRRADGSFESRPLEDMAPFLSREEIYENMHLFDE
ncbi:thiamine pyrophosphate-binding protein [Nevskia soli]|uniref:thiamine pyrophosphate-binding protein n=1 Tax=Nevskia soli TaxID=418856 RepID=UPI0015D7A621|nr:thiamine pyrophosphate-binding protein [Nevskia soli]